GVNIGRLPECRDVHRAHQRVEGDGDGSGVRAREATRRISGTGDDGGARAPRDDTGSTRLRVGAEFERVDVEADEIADGDVRWDDGGIRNESARPASRGDGAKRGVTPSSRAYGEPRHLAPLEVAQCTLELPLSIRGRRPIAC